MRRGPSGYTLSSLDARQKTRERTVGRLPSLETGPFVGRTITLREQEASIYPPSAARAIHFALPRAAALRRRRTAGYECAADSPLIEEVPHVHRHRTTSCAPGTGEARHSPEAAGTDPETNTLMPAPL
jgi:hypothetical protein